MLDVHCNIVDEAPAAARSGSGGGAPADAVSKRVAAEEEPSLQCELVEDALRRKVVRLYGALKDYVETEAGPKGKGLVVAGHRGAALQALGVDVGWALSRLGKRNGLQIEHMDGSLLLTPTVGDC